MIIEYLTNKYREFPANGRIFLRSNGSDITPIDEESIDYLNTLSLDEVEIIIPPQDVTAIIVSLVISLAVTLYTLNQIPNAANRSIPESSPNNGLSSRTNEPRYGARRPYILGTVNSVPDLIAPPYTVVNANGQEVEYNYMFVSEHTVTASIFREANTQLKYLSGSGCALYHPNNSPTKGSPAVVSGDVIDEPFIWCKLSQSVNGQTLRAPNKIIVEDEIEFKAPNKITFKKDNDLAEKYRVGEVLDVTDSLFGGELFSRAGFIEGNKITYPNTTLGNMPSYMTVGSDLYAGLNNRDYKPTDIVKITAIEATTEGSGQDATTKVVVTLSDSLPTLNDNTKSETIDNLKTTIYFTEVVNVLGTTDENGDVSGQADLTFSKEIDAEITTTEIIHYSSISVYVSTGADLVSFNGSYTITDISELELEVQETWAVSSIEQECAVSVDGPRWTDYVILEDSQMNGVISNFTCPQGSYKDNGKRQYKSNNTVVVGITEVDKNDNFIGLEQTFSIDIKGSDFSRDAVNKTLRASNSKRCAIRAHRSTYKDEEFEGSVVDEIKWKHLYSFRNIGDHDINNTRVRTMTTATAGALAIKQRKFNMPDATRCLPRYENGTMSTELYPTRSVADALVAVATDPKIGRRSIDELDLDQIYAEEARIKAYFGTDKAAEFNYTLDSSDLTFEDTFQLLASAVFSKAYRRSLKHYLSFEKPQDTSTLLFNHRNKIPNSEKRNISFGITKNYDGVTAKWIDSDGIERTVSVPNNNLQNADEIKFVGLNEFQATKHAWRQWNKHLYQNLFTEFSATQEASLTVLTQRILVADNVIGETYDGDVKSQDGFNLELSQDVPYNGWIHLQLPSAELQAIQYIRTAPYQITLLNPTQTVLSTDPNNYQRAKFLISESSTQEQAFLLLDRSGDKEFKLRAGNYDARFYSEDLTPL